MGFAKDICVVNLVLERVVESGLSSVTTGIPSKGALTLCPFEETQHAADVPQYLSSPPWPTQGQTGPQSAVVVSNQSVSIFAVIEIPPETSARILDRR